VRLLMTRMERLSVLYAKISIAASEPQPELAKYFDHFRRLDFGSVYPLLLALYEDYDEGQFDLGQFVSTLGVLHSFILRRMVAGVPSNALSGLFIALCKAKPVTEEPSEWLSEVLIREDKNRRWPNDAEFAERWSRSPLYGSRACQVVLECLEESYGHHEIVGFAESSIEHVMPQSLTPEWSEMLGTDAGEIHGEWLHTIGNLTLTGYNPELGNRSYREKRATLALSHFELNRHFRDEERWGPIEIENRATELFNIALDLWPRPEIAAMSANASAAIDRRARAAFHGDCVRLAQKHLGLNVSKLSQTRYQSSDGRIRLMCAVSAIHEGSRETPYFWFGFHPRQLDFLKAAEQPYLCLGCSSAETTLLFPLNVIQGSLDSMSTSVVAQHRHIVVQKKMGRLVLLLLDGKDGADLTAFNIGSFATQTRE
jgi:hypothetical protein